MGFLCWASSTVAVASQEGRCTLWTRTDQYGRGAQRPWIEGCHFEAGADDVLVRPCLSKPVEHVVDERTAVLSSAGLWSIERGTASSSTIRAMVSPDKPLSSV